MKFPRLKSAPHPIWFVLGYFLAILLYALLYWITQGLNEEVKALESLYFSVVTITTLGYGDISPTNGFARFLTASEALVGVMLLGLFLFSLSARLAHNIHREDQERNAELIKEGERVKLELRSRTLQPLLDRYIRQVSILMVPFDEQNIRMPFEIIKECEENFEFNVLADIYLPSIDGSQHASMSRIERLFSIQKQLAFEINEVSKAVNLTHWPELHKWIGLWLSYTEFANPSDVILSAPFEKMGGSSKADFIIKMIREHGELPASVSVYENGILTPYYLLYDQLKRLGISAWKIAGEMHSVMGIIILTPEMGSQVVLNRNRY